jgi:DNA-binding protein H-NS
LLEFYKFFISTVLSDQINTHLQFNGNHRIKIMNISAANLKSMSIDRLCALRDQVDGVISAKITEERRAVQHKLGNLDRLAGAARGKGAGRGGVRGPVAAKYRNPENPAETWAGRGLKPRWLSEVLKAGGKLEDFAIASQRKTRGRRKKAAAK